MPPKKPKSKAPPKPKTSKNASSSKTNSDEPPKNINPYEVLSLTKACTAAEIRSTYLKLALKLHPDKAKLEDREAAHVKFQELAFAYAVLSDEGRRKRYDATGRTDQIPHEGEDGFDWTTFYKRQFEDVVTGEALEAFKQQYQGSEEEREAILSAYIEGEGDIAYIFSMVMCSDEVEDEARFRKIINDAISKGEVEPYDKFTNESDTAKQKRKRNAAKERKAAMEYAKELGVYDKLFGKGENEAEKNEGQGDVEMDDADEGDEADDANNTIDLSQASNDNEDEEEEGEQEEQLKKGGVEVDEYDSDETEEIPQPEGESTTTTSKRSDSEGHPHPGGFTSINPPAPKKPPLEAKEISPKKSQATENSQTFKSTKYSKTKIQSTVKSKPAPREKESEVVVEPTTAKSANVNKSKPSAPSLKSTKNAESSSMSSLASLIQSKNKNSHADLISKLEAKYVSSSSNGRKRKAKDALAEGGEQGPEPTEEEFLAAKKKIEENAVAAANAKNKTGSGRAKGGKVRKGKIEEKPEGDREEGEDKKIEKAAKGRGRGKTKGKGTDVSATVASTDGDKAFSVPTSTAGAKSRKVSEKVEEKGKKGKTLKEASAPVTLEGTTRRSKRVKRT